MHYVNRLLERRSHRLESGRLVMSFASRDLGCRVFCSGSQSYAMRVQAVFTLRTAWHNIRLWDTRSSSSGGMKNIWEFAHEKDLCDCGHGTMGRGSYENDWRALADPVINLPLCSPSRAKEHSLNRQIASLFAPCRQRDSPPARILRDSFMRARCLLFPGQGEQ